MEKSADAFRTISEVSDILGTPAHVLRFWESRFPQIRPVKRAGGRRYYRPSDVALLSGIKRLLHDEGLTIRGVQKVLREQGIRHVSGLTLVGVEAATVDLVEEKAATSSGDPPKIVAQPRSAAEKKPAAPRRLAAPAPDPVARRAAEPLPLWAAVVERVTARSNGESRDTALIEAAATDADTLWLPPLLRALSPAQVTAHRTRLAELQSRLLALHNRVADTARRPAS
jgi:DNA-binding transcriptional MerR regulator